MSPRKLQAQTKYQAFLVPTYKVGLEAALGLDITADKQDLSWDASTDVEGLILPYYHQWEFSTASKGDFEELVRKLEPRELTDMGTRTIDCSNPGYGMLSNGLTMEMNGALKLVSLKDEEGKPIESEEKMPDEIQDKLANLLNVREENGKLRLTPPVYGEWYIQRENELVKVDPTQEQWLEELNLDFRYRAAAGLGVQFVKENQEQLIKAAWEQMTRVKKVNRELNLGRFGRELSKGMHKRLTNMNTNNLVQSLMPLQHKLAKDGDGSGQGSKRVNSRSGTKTNMATAIRKNSPVTNMMTKVKVKKYMPQYAVSDFIPLETTQLVCPGYRPKTLGWTPDPEDRTYKLWSENKGQDTFNNWNTIAKDKLKPEKTIEDRLHTRVQRFRECEKNYHKPQAQEQHENERSRSLNEQAVNNDMDRLRPVIWYPEFHRPMYRFLRNLSQEYILPGLDKIPQNTIGLLENNRAFIEAFMLGLNHEFASELRWREFPTDMRGTYFRSFWDTTIYSLDINEQKQFRTTPIARRLLANLRQRHSSIPSDIEKAWDQIEASYTEATPNKTQKAIADDYEEAVEKWLLTRDEDKDIDHIAKWKRNSHLGDHPTIVQEKSENSAGSEQAIPDPIVILIKGELLLKFGNALVYLVEKDEGENQESTRPDFSKPQKRKFPVFEGALHPDIIFLGFPIDSKDAAKYFLVFEERITDLRFGLDAKAEGGEENNLSWEHFSTLSNEGYLDGHKPDILKEEWENAAFIGQVMVQKSVRAAVSLDKMLPKT